MYYLLELCGVETGGVKGRGEDDEEEGEFTTIHLILGIVITFVVTALAVAFLTSVICLVVGSYKRKKYNLKAAMANNDYFDTPLDTKEKL